MRLNSVRSVTVPGKCVPVVNLSVTSANRFCRIVEKSEITADDSDTENEDLAARYSRKYTSTSLLI